MPQYLAQYTVTAYGQDLRGLERYGEKKEYRLEANDGKDAFDKVQNRFRELKRTLIQPKITLESLLEVKEINFREIELSKRFVDVIENDVKFKEASNIVLTNSSGNVWLIGGYVYRTLAHLLYESERPPVDVDFIVENPRDNFTLPHGWKLSKNRYGNPKFVGQFEIDYAPLATIHSVSRRGLEPTFENYLSGTPLTIQSIGYNLKDQRVIGDIGLHALQTKTIGVNDKEQAKIYEAKKGIPIEEIIKRKSESLGFRPVL